MVKKSRNQLILSLLIKKTNPYNDENSIGSNWSDLTEKDEEDIAMTNFIESLKKKKTDEENFSKFNWIIGVSYIMKRKIKKIFFEVIF